jgi:hypothetical protein
MFATIKPQFIRDLLFFEQVAIVVPGIPGMEAAGEAHTQSMYDF